MGLMLSCSFGHEFLESSNTKNHETHENTKNTKKRFWGISEKLDFFRKNSFFWNAYFFSGVGRCWFVNAKPGGTLGLQLLGSIGYSVNFGPQRTLGFQ